MICRIQSAETVLSDPLLTIDQRKLKKYEWIRRKRERKDHWHQKSDVMKKMSIILRVVHAENKKKIFMFLTENTKRNKF